MVFNATLNNISVISWRSVSLVNICRKRRNTEEEKNILRETWLQKIIKICKLTHN